MKKIIGTSNRVLDVDLTAMTIETITISTSDRKMYLGGKGLGLKLIYDRMSMDADPLGPDNIIAVMPGVLMGTGAPCSGRFAAVAKSPQTGVMASSSCGGPFGMALKTAGWDGLLIRGVSASPVYLLIDHKGATIRDASHLWGKTTQETQQETRKNGEALVIGPAGENLVSFANIASGERYFGRGGLGSVMGAKQLKAIVAKGKHYKIVPRKEKAFKKIKKKGNDFINANPWTSVANRQYGTLSIVNNTKSAGILPVRNFQDGTSANAYKITGETVRRQYNTEHHACKPCTILCGKKAVFDGEEMPVPEYETMGLLGSNLDIFDPPVIARWNKICGDMGMDTMSAGGTIAWVMEAAEKGLVESGLKFGNPEGVSEALYDIGYCRNFGKEMAGGSKGLSKKYGGEDFAMNVKGMEIAAYDPRGSYGTGLGYAVANRGGCHLASTMMAMENFMCMLAPHTTLSKAKWVVFFENLINCINSLHTCIFTSYAYMLELTVPKYSSWLSSLIGMQFSPGVLMLAVDFSVMYRKLWTSVTGISISRSAFNRAGERIQVLERHMNKLAGGSRKDDKLPRRLLAEGRQCDKHNRTVPLETMLEKYYRIRGYDPADGTPGPALLKKLKIAACAVSYNDKKEIVT
ncbi:MAG: aldehyde ferredoxin oxidoreductase family protein [Thermodesulfobacteriota bacterium]|nr:aldehyde ferredoxin oxidoreductase family protein [Thermodesulfobacteriota bacterium]